VASGYATLHAGRSDGLKLAVQTERSNAAILDVAVHATRITGWIAWYRFARETLDQDHGEAVVYANLRHVEESNRAALKGRTTETFASL
jgi:hypothetical protein